MRHTLTVCTLDCETVQATNSGREYDYPVYRTYIDVNVLDENGNSLGVYRADAPVIIRIKPSNRA